MMVYCDTSTLLTNVKKHDDQPKALKELHALEKLLALKVAGKIQMVRSNVVLREIESPSKSDGWPERVARLRDDFKALAPVARDEKVVRFHSQFNERGGIAYPLVSDVQNEDLRDKLVRRGLKRRDAEHIVQAAANNCDVFLTRDGKSIIKRHRDWLECELPLKIRFPSELVAEVIAS
jgi:hypothetical protein